jgi:suppressor of fused protein SUFU
VSAPEPTDAVERALRAHFAHRPARASVSFLGVEPIEVLRFDAAPGERAYVSLGMSRRAMTAATESVLGTDGPRAELMLFVRGAPAAGDDAWRRLAVLAAAPSVEGVVYTAGMTVDLGQPLVVGSRCTGVVVVESGLAAIETAQGAVTILQVLPATSTELAWCRVHGAAALRERWAERQTDLFDLGRRPVALD